MIWEAALDPGTLVVEAVPARRDDPDGIEPAALSRWLAFARDARGWEHAVFSDGWHHVRFDVRAGTLREERVVLRYVLAGSVSVRPKLLPLRRLIAFSLHHRFPATLFPPDPRIARWLLALRAHDAVHAGASHREIAQVLFGAGRVAGEWQGASDSLRSRIRRLVREAARMARGGYRSLLQARTGD
nr:DUF2285 domain-containing protein [uncultured Sphingomonas sp.]